MAYYFVSDTDLGSVADAIRTRGGTSEQLEFPDEFNSAIAAIPGAEELSVSDMTLLQISDAYTSNSSYTTVTHTATLDRKKIYLIRVTNRSRTSTSASWTYSGAGTIIPLLYNGSRWTHPTAQTSSYYSFSISGDTITLTAKGSGFTRYTIAVYDIAQIGTTGGE